MSVGVKGVHIVPDVVFDATERSGYKNITPVWLENSHFDDSDTVRTLVTTDMS